MFPFYFIQHENLINLIQSRWTINQMIDQQMNELLLIAIINIETFNDSPKNFHMQAILSLKKNDLYLEQ